MDFQYVGRSITGNRTKGNIEADSKQQALKKLESRGLIVINLEETKPWNKDITYFQRVKNKDFIIFLRQYSTLIHSGINISEATKTMTHQTDSQLLKKTLVDIDKKLDQGIPLSKATEMHPKVFPSLLVHMIHAGEASGQLDEILHEMADYYEKQYQNQQKIITALLYPTVVGAITIILGLFLLMFVVPQFVNMFQSMGQELPLYTQLIIQSSEIAGKYWWILIPIIVAIMVGYFYIKRSDSLQIYLDTLKMRIPLTGKLVQQGALVRLTKTMSTLVNSAVPMIEAVDITSKIVQNRVMEEILNDSKNALTNGDSLAKPMKNHWAFPKLVIQMIEIGEKTGSLDQMLHRAALFYEQEVDQLSTRIKTLIEPFMIVFLTVFVGGVIVAIVLPMFNMFEQF
ncbi:type II secretion system F family protein [Oceanobacillus sp. 1P07AA]|uniref:type II secretion system F family protein n=1 Tax=Oceanobacillus sp. 1P07AA TaxID=3132293 RepID=UPI0039A6F868